MIYTKIKIATCALVLLGSMLLPACGALDDTPGKDGKAQVILPPSELPDSNEPLDSKIPQPKEKPKPGSKPPAQTPAPQKPGIQPPAQTPAPQKPGIQPPAQTPAPKKPLPKQQGFPTPDEEKAKVELKQAVESARTEAEAWDKLSDQLGSQAKVHFDKVKLCVDQAIDLAPKSGLDATLQTEISGNLAYIKDHGLKDILSECQLVAAYTIRFVILETLNKIGLPIP